MSCFFIYMLLKRGRISITINPRAWLHQTILTNSALNIFHNGRVYQAQSMRTADLPKPYIVHRFGNDTDENIAESDIQPHRQFFQVYVYDEIGDYVQIDQAIYALKQALSSALHSPPDNVITVIYLETSQDFIDETLCAIFRYARFQLIMS